MTGVAERHRRATLIVGVAAVSAVVVTAVAAAVGGSVLYNSTQGQSAARSSLEVRPLPETPNLLLGVVDDDGRLATMAVMTLSPAGQGGSVVTLPVTASATRPTESTPASTIADSFEDDAVGGLGLSATSILGLSFDQVVVLERDELAALLEPVGAVQVDLPADVIADEDGIPNVVASAGPQLLDGDGVAEALAAIWSEGSDAAGGIDPPEADENTEAVWDGVAGSVGGGLDTGAAVGTGVGSGAKAFLDRLFNGPVSVRRLQSSDIGIEADEPVRLIDRIDVLLVFGQVSPRKVAASLDAISVRVVIPFNEEGVSNAEVATAAIGRLLFVRVNVVSVSASASEDGAPDVSEIQVLNPGIKDDDQRFEAVVGEYEVVDASYDIPGVDVVITIGASALSFYDVG